MNLATDGDFSGTVIPYNFRYFVISCFKHAPWQDIDQVLLHEIIIIIFFTVFSSSEVLDKITSIRSKLPTAACWYRGEKRGNCEANQARIQDFEMGG